MDSHTQRRIPKGSARQARRLRRRRTASAPPARVTQLRLVSQGLTGTIPPELARLPLTSLRLRGNDLSGCVPPALWSVRDNDLHHLGLPDCPG